MSKFMLHFKSNIKSTHSTYPVLKHGVCSGLDIRLSSVEAILSAAEVSKVNGAVLI